jgi:hypothetical protein
MAQTYRSFVSAGVEACQTWCCFWIYLQLLPFLRQRRGHILFSRGVETLTRRGGSQVGPCWKLTNFRGNACGLPAYHDLLSSWESLRVTVVGKRMPQTSRRSIDTSEDVLKDRLTHTCRVGRASLRDWNRTTIAIAYFRRTRELIFLSRIFPEFYSTTNGYLTP